MRLSPYYNRLTRLVRAGYPRHYHWNSIEFNHCPMVIALEQWGTCANHAAYARWQHPHAASLPSSSYPARSTLRVRLAFCSSVTLTILYCKINEKLSIAWKTSKVEKLSIPWNTSKVTRNFVLQRFPRCRSSWTKPFLSGGVLKNYTIANFHLWREIVTSFTESIAWYMKFQMSDREGNLCD